MKIIFLKENVERALGALERVTGDQGGLPILKHVLISTVENRVRFSATNLEMGVVAYCLGKVQAGGSLTVPLSSLLSIVRNCDSERIQFEADKGALRVQTDNYRATLQGMVADEFPIIPRIEHANQSITLTGDVLAQGILEVVPAAQISEIRPEISGVFLTFELTLMKLVATDSFRLAEKTLTHSQFTSTFTQGFRAIVPLRTAQELARIFAEEREVSLLLDPHQLLARSGERELISRLIDGQYPDYEQIVPKILTTELTLPREQFAAALRLVGTLSGKVHDVRLKLHESGRALTISSAYPHVGENTYLVPAAVKGEPMGEVAFNWRYLLEGLKPMRGKEFVLGMNGDAKPALMRSPEDASYRYIVMPIKP